MLKTNSLEEADGKGTASKGSKPTPGTQQEDLRTVVTYSIEELIIIDDLSGNRKYSKSKRKENSLGPVFTVFWLHLEH
jgi:hypothetical protein